MGEEGEGRSSFNKYCFVPNTLGADYLETLLKKDI